MEKFNGMDSPANTPTPRLSTPHIINCPTENDIGSNFEAYFPRTITWNVQNSAPTSASASPARTSNLPPVERKNAPTPANTTATTDSQCTFSRHRMNNTIGTRTTYRLVMKPAFPAVVYATPSCCNALPTKSTNPATNIHLYCSREESEMRKAFRATNGSTTIPASK